MGQNRHGLPLNMKELIVGSAAKKTYSSKVEQDIFKKETQVASKRFFSDPKAFPSLFADGSRSGDTGLPSPGKRRGAPGVHPFVPGFGVPEEIANVTSTLDHVRPCYTMLQLHFGWTHYFANARFKPTKP
jgi:hypothetical protein